MRHLLTSVSLAAFVAGVGIAGAQTASQQPERPGAQQQRPPLPSGSEDRQRRPEASEERPGARQPGEAQQRGEERRRSGEAQQRGEERQRSGEAQQREEERQRPGQAQQRGEERRRSGEAQQREERQRPGQAQQRGGEEGQRSDQAQQERPGGGEVSGRIAGNPEVQSRVRRSVDDMRPVNVNVAVRVGASIPRTVELQPVPPAIIEIAPRYREYRVIRVRDEIVIVNPRSYEVVEVIRVGEARRAGGRASIELTAQQRQLVLRHAREARSARATARIRVVEGQPLTERVELEVIPQEIITEVPVLREYRYFVSGDQVVIVDPETNLVAEVLR